MDHPAANTLVEFRVRGFLPGQVECGLRDLGFAAIGTARDERDALAVEFAAFKVHASVNASRVLAQYGIEADERFNQRLPVPVGHQAKTVETDGEERGWHRLRIVQLGFRFIQDRLEQSEFEKRREVPKFIQSKLLTFLKCSNEQIERNRGKFPIGRAKKSSGDGGHTGFVPVSAEDHAGKPGDVLGARIHRSNGGAKEAEVCAELAYRSAKLHEARFLFGL